MLLLEGQLFHFHATKKKHLKDAYFMENTPVFAMSKFFMNYERNDKTDDILSNIMEAHERNQPMCKMFPLAYIA